MVRDDMKITRVCHRHENFCVPMNPEKNLLLLVPEEAGMPLPIRKCSPEESLTLTPQPDRDGNAYYVR